MSIPPLVCSTPPPPEQCEDDKDPEDFDLHYHLSQEEDEGNDYDYGNYSNFNDFQSSTSNTSSEFNKSKEEKKKVEDKNVEGNNLKETEDHRRGSLDDDVLEDLNLKIDHEPAAVMQKNINEECEANSKEKTTKPQDLQSDIPVENVDSTNLNAFELKSENIELGNIDKAEDSPTLNLNEKQVPLNEVLLKADDKTGNKSCDINTADEIIPTNLEGVATESTSPEHHFNENLQKPLEIENDIDEFEDFDDFQFVSSEDKASASVLTAVSDNPWENDVNNKDDGFREFTANFDDKKAVTHANEQTKEVEAEDDFGDFDEFQSVNDTTLQKPPESFEEVPVLNLHLADSESQIMERINKVMHTVFQEEIGECNNVCQSKLGGSLGETWRHLKETDVRQPYIVNWNNSLAQKTLLKALCIDSRNILFGPKWSSNMPKYAATLSNAPLQPQKQTGQSNAPQNETIASEKTMNKPWTDPFTADGQESCQTPRENTAIETGPTDLDVFEAATSTKPDKIYSSTLSIQPMRQINLPDTHIFTPTNSEIPRSKTIHYDNTSTPTILLPQSTSEPNMSSSHNSRSENDNDYWEFQDFKGVSDNQVPESTINKDQSNENIPNTEATNKPNLTVATQVLQPIKLEPIMPTLNWPDPGEVKETFDDFSDFISNSPMNNEKLDSVPQSFTPANLQNSVKNPDENHVPNENSINATSVTIDDDFDMFQSALPPIKNISQYSKTESVHKDHTHSFEVVHNFSDFDAAFSKDDNVKSENISVNTRPINNVHKNFENASNTITPQVPSFSMIMTNTNVLQPTPASSSQTKQTQQKTGQILQPLSLESYSQINWPNPGIDLQDLSRFNPVESLQSLKNDSNSHSKTSSPVHNHKSFTNSNQTSDEDIWGDFVSSKPKQQPIVTKKQTTFVDDEEWTDFVSSPSVNPQNGLNTISLNVHTNSSMQKSSNSSKYPIKSNEISLDIPALNYITPKSNKSFNERHFQNL